MDAKNMYEQALQVATEVINTVEPEDYDQPTPDTEWTVRDLINHMLYELAWSADVLRGKTIAEVGDAYDGNLISDDLKGTWRRYSEAALSALEDANLEDIVHLSFGDVSAEEYIWQNGSEYAIHAWDLGEAINLSVVFDQPLTEAIYQYVMGRTDDMAASGLFGEPVDVAETADLMTKLLALYGRQR